MNAGGLWAINPHGPVAGRRNSSKNPHPPTTASDTPALRERKQSEGRMADWRMRMEKSMVVLANGNETRLERAQEIMSWFSTRKEMRRVAKRVFRNLTVEEDERLMPNGFTTPTGAPVSSLAALVWAMEETEFGSPSQKAKWWGFCSRHRFLAGPEDFVVGAVPIPIEDSEEEMESEAEERETVPDLGKSSDMGKKKQKAQLPRRSPHFLRRSPCLLNLSKSAPAE
ncbi:hypothetical protein VPH35_140456 [Triticum aestivum]